MSDNSSAPTYYLNSVTTNVCGQILKPNDIVFASWNLVGQPTYDSCFVSIRPISNLHDDGAYVAQVYPHPQCAGSSTNIRIPKEPENATFPFNGSDFTVRVNSHNGIHADSCTFRIKAGYHPGLTWVKKLSIVNIVFVVILGVLSLTVGIWSANKSAKVQRDLNRDKDTREEQRETERIEREERQRTERMEREDRQRTEKAEREDLESRLKRLESKLAS